MSNDSSGGSAGGAPAASTGAFNEYAPHPYQSLNADGEVLAVNDAWLETLGYDRDAVEGRWFGDFLENDSEAKFEAKFPEFQSAGGVAGIEFEMNCADGETITVSFDGRIEYDDDGSVLRTHCQFKEITERKRQEQKYQNLFEDSRDALVIFDKDGMIECNEQTLELFGVDSVDTLLNKTPWELSPPQQPDGRDTEAAAMEHVQSAFDTGVDFFEWRHQRADGTTFPAEVKLSRFSYGDETVLLALIRDISARKEREQKLGNAREASQKVIETSPIPIWVQDVEEIVYANEAAMSFYGYDEPESLLGTSALSFVPEEHRVPARKRIEAMLETGEPMDELTDTFITKDGTTREAIFAATPIMYDGEQAIVVVAKDITEQKEREQELREAKDRFQALFEKAPEAIIVHDTDGNIREFNQQKMINIGYSKDELTSMHIADLDVSLSKEEIQTLLAGLDVGERLQVETKLKRKDGSTFPVELWVNKIEQGADVRCLAFARDITERKAHEAEISRLKERLDLAVEGANLGVWDWDITTDEVEFNEQWAAMLGLSPDDVEQHYNAWKKRVHPEDLPVVEAGVDAHLASETEIIDEEYRMQASGGEWKWIRTVGRVVSRDEDDNPIRAVGINLDVTERKRAEQRLEAERERYERLFELLPSPVAHTTLENDEHRIENVNPAFEATFGHSVESIRGESIDEILSVPDDGDSNLGILSQRLIEEGTIKTEVRRDTVDGPRTFRLDVKLHEFQDGSTEAYGAYTDITERQQREEAFLESIRDIITLVDEDGTIRYDSPAIEDIHGYDPEKRVGDPAIDYIHPEDRDRVGMPWKGQVAEDSRFQEVEFRAKDADGSWRWVESRANVSRRKSQVDGIVVSTRDISERKRREQELETVFHHMDDAVFVHSDAEPFIFVNQTTVERYGYDESELSEMTPSDINADLDVSQVKEVIDAINREGTYRFETIHQTAAGEEIPVEINASSITFRGEPAVLSIARDISDRKNRVKRLEKREQILRSLHTTTEAFLAADSEAAVYEQITDGIADSLEFQHTTVWQFDSETGALVPTAPANRRSESVEPPSVVEPGDHPLWQAFATGETRTIQDLDPDHLPDSDLSQVTSVLVVPIRDEAVIVVENLSEKRFGTVEIEMVELLAENAGAMLARLHREAEIQELDHEITDMAAQMQAMESWMTAIETIQNQLAKIDTIEGMEQVVCAELANVKGIDFAWIGRPETADTDISPVEWAGTGYGYLESVEQEAGNETVPHLRVATTREEVAVANVADRVSEGDWAKDALAADFRSLVSVPIEYDDVLYGVLTAYASEKEAFGQLSRDLMTDIGAMLANAYRMVNIHAGTSDAEVEELEFSIQDDRYLLYALAQASEATLSFDAVLETTESTVRILLTVVDGDGETVLEQAESMLNIPESDWFGKPADGQVTLTVAKPFLAEAIAEHGGRLVESVAAPRGATIRIQHSATVPVRQMTEWLSTQYETVELLARRSRPQPEQTPFENVEEMLTERQYETLKAAYEGGYYETPKGITGEQIAESFDVSRPAVYNHLQAAQRRLLKRVFDPDVTQER